MKVLLTIVLVLLAGHTTSLKAEEADVTWVRFLGDRINGGDAIGAWPSGEGLTVLASTRGFDLDGKVIPSGHVLLRLNEGGVIVQATSVDAPDAAYSFAEPGIDGAFYMFALQYDGDRGHALLFKFGPDGHVRWQRELPHFQLGDGRIQPEALAAGPDGSVAVIWRHPLGDGIPTSTAYPLPPPRIALFAANGTRFWRRASEYRFATALAVGPGPTVYVAAGRGTLAAIGPGGNTLWRRALIPRREGEYPIIGSLAVSPAGRICGAGLVYHVARREQTAWPDAIVACREGGQPQWFGAFGGNDSDAATDIAFLPGDGVAVIGGTESPVFDGTKTSGDDDMFVATFGHDGAPGGVPLVLGGADDDVATQLVVTGAGGARFAVGSTLSKTFAGETTTGGDGLVVVRLR